MITERPAAREGPAPAHLETVAGEQLRRACNPTYGRAGAYIDGVKSNALARISATIPSDLLAFLDAYQRDRALGSRSVALREAIAALKERELARGYAELGQAQRDGLETYPPEHTDGLEL